MKKALTDAMMEFRRQMHAIWKKNDAKSSKQTSFITIARFLPSQDSRQISLAIYSRRQQFEEITTNYKFVSYAHDCTNTLFP